MRGLRWPRRIRDVWERVRGIVPAWEGDRLLESLSRRRRARARPRLHASFGFRSRGHGSSPSPAFGATTPSHTIASVLQAIRDAGMSAMVTLVHNTWPLHVQAAGKGAGPLDPGFPDRVARFAGEVAQRLGDLIDDYVTLNEPDQLVYGWIKGFWMRAYAMPPGQPPYQSGDAQMDDVLTADSQPISRAREGARGDSADSAGCARRHQSARPRLAAMDTAHRRSQRHPSAVAGGGEAPGGAVRELRHRRERPRRLHDRTAHADPRARRTRLLFRALLLHVSRGRCMPNATRRFRPTREHWRGRIAVVAQTLHGNETSAAGFPPRRSLMRIR